MQILEQNYGMGVLPDICALGMRGVPINMANVCHFLCMEELLYCISTQISHIWYTHFLFFSVFLCDMVPNMTQLLL